MNSQDTEHIFLCPKCGIDTLHYIAKRKQDVVGIICSHCHTPSLVRTEILSYHQLKWEEELRQILNHLEDPFDEH